MTQGLARIDPATVPIALRVFGEERLALLKEQIGRGWVEPMTDTELEFIAGVCQRTRLDPLAVPRQIHFTKFKDRKLNKAVITPITGIDGLRLIAQRSRAYGGATPYLYCGPDGVWKEFWDSDETPTAAKCGVKRRGWTDWLWGVATWKEWAKYEPTDWDDRQRRYMGRKLSDFWQRMPAHMLGKTAEAIALKRAFPEETNELELANLEQESREQDARNAKRYTEIFGDESSGTSYDLPQHALNAAGQAVDTSTGELLEDDHSPQASGSAVPPSRAELWQENRRLVDKARELGISGRTLNTRAGEDVLVAANAELRARIADVEGELAAAGQETFA